MIRIEVPPNPNCAGCDQIAFQESDPGSPARVVRAITVTTPSGDALCDAAGVGADGVFGPVLARCVNDSAEGTVYLVTGGEWGIRFRRRTDAHKPWDLSDRTQWGEPYKVYGISPDIVF